MPISVRIQEYIARDSKRNARLVVQRIRAATRQLARFPESGRTVPDRISPEYCELIVGSYRIIYEYIPDDATVEVLVVAHGSRLLPVV